MAIKMKKLRDIGGLKREKKAVSIIHRDLGLCYGENIRTCKYNFSSGIGIDNNLNAIQQ